MFDTTDLGPDLTFETRPAPQLEPLDPTVARLAVYLGHDVESEPYYLWHSGSDDIFDFVGQIVADFGSVGRLETSYGTLMTGPGIFDDPPSQSLGFPTGFVRSVTGQPIELVAEWHSLPEEVSVVAFYNGEEAIGWQTPVSGSAGIATTLTSDKRDNNETKMVAMDVDGTVIDTLTPFPAQTSRMPPKIEPSPDTTSP